MLNFKVAILLALILIVQAEYEPSQKAKDCMEKTKVDVDTLRHLVRTEDVVSENDEKMVKFFECCYGEHISDTNDFVVDDKITTHAENIFTYLFRGKHESGTQLARDALEHCKHEKGDTKGKTAIRVVNCLKVKAADYKKTE